MVCRRTTGPDPIEIAQRAADLGIKVHTVAFGTEHGVIPGYEGYSFFVKVDQETLKAVAQITGGQYFYAASADELKAAYAGLQSKLSLETRRTEISFVALSAMLILATALVFILVTSKPSFSFLVIQYKRALSSSATVLR